MVDIGLFDSDRKGTPRTTIAVILPHPVSVHLKSMESFSNNKHISPTGRLISSVTSGHLEINEHGYATLTNQAKRGTPVLISACRQVCLFPDEFSPENPHELHRTNQNLFLRVPFRIEPQNQISNFLFETITKSMRNSYS